MAILHAAMLFDRKKMQLCGYQLCSTSWP